jgi:hypothetical protein
MADILKASNALKNAAIFFSSSDEGSNKPRNIKASVKCLFTALSLVLPASNELELRLMLGEQLLKYSKNVAHAAEQFQKSYSLVQMVLRIKNNVDKIEF